MVSHQMIAMRMQEEIDELRAALAQPEPDLKLVANFLKEYGLEVLDVIAALKTQPEQEPVAWINEHGHIDRGLDAILDPTGWTPLYTHPPQRKPLTERQIFEELGLGAVDVQFVRMVERAHGIGDLSNLFEADKADSGGEV
jgi:hypothetical protein